ncbi:MAG: hypothetical protein ACR2PG_25005 [Hyphomicrobiaceae bacterium]
MNDLSIREKIANLLSGPHQLEPAEVADLQNILAERQRVGQFYASVPLLLSAIENSISQRAKANGEKPISTAELGFTRAAPEHAPAQTETAPPRVEETTGRGGSNTDRVDAVLPLANDLYENRHALNDVDQTYIEMLQTIYNAHGTLPLFVDIYVRAQHAALPRLIEAYQTKHQ